jgi:hypothetical protein
MQPYTTESESPLLPPNGADRRREVRISTNDPALMHVLNPLLGTRQAIQVLDVSKNGMKFRSGMELQRGTLIQVYLRDIVAMGEVRHCTRCEDEFHVGVQLDNVFRRCPQEDMS